MTFGATQVVQHRPDGAGPGGAGPGVGDGPGGAGVGEEGPTDPEIRFGFDFDPDDPAISSHTCLLPVLVHVKKVELFITCSLQKMHLPCVHLNIPTSSVLLVLLGVHTNFVALGNFILRP